ncbi:MAG: hypothetical protein JSS56_22700 [Proteobacteria bacterium]|nr:hypothetical protein [Pseudomonadota bacterium]
MVILADFSDTQFLMTCKRCEQTLQEGDRFCRYCGQDQLEGDPSAVIDITQPASNGDAVAPEALPTQRSARRDAWRQGASTTDDAQHDAASDGRPGGSVAPRRWLVGLAFAVVLGLAAVLLYELYLGRQEEAARVRQSAQQSAAPMQAPETPASADTPAHSIKAPAPPVAPTRSSEAPPPAVSSADVPEPAAKVPPPTPEQAPPPTIVTPAPPAAPPAAPSSPSAPLPPAAEAPNQNNACPDALAAMALCTKR